MATDNPGVKAILGYDIVAGVDVEEYERWIWDIHVPDLLANPHVDRLVFNTVVESVDSTSAGTTTVTDEEPMYRVAELHFADMEAYRSYRDWFVDHPIPVERSPQGRTEFRFYVLTDSVTATRERPGEQR